MMKIEKIEYVENREYDENTNNNNDNFFNLQVAKSPSRLRFKANLSRERSQLYRAQSKPDESA